MRTVVSSRSARRAIATIACGTLALGSACHRWVAASGSPSETVRNQRPGQLLVHRGDGSTVTLRNPRVITDGTRALGTSAVEPGASDTLIAGELVARTLSSGEAARGGGARSATVLVRASEIRSVELRELDGWRSTAFIGLAAGAIIASLVAFSR